MEFYRCIPRESITIYGFLYNIYSEFFFVDGSIFSTAMRISISLRTVILYLLLKEKSIRYGDIDYGVDGVKQAIDIVRKLIEILDQMCRGVKLG